jgi:hypothetical protein
LRKLFNHDLSVWLTSSKKEKTSYSKDGEDIEVSEVGSILSAQRLAG